MKSIEVQEERPFIITLFAILTLVFVGGTLLLAFLPTDLIGGDSPYADPERNSVLLVMDIFLAIGKGLGAYLILKMRKIGFYLYAVCEVLVAFFSIIGLQSQLAWLESYPMPATAAFDPETALILGTGFFLLMSLVWIGVYASHLQKMS